jgi:hypothetical protein
MSSERFQRQNFLGAHSEERLGQCRVGIVGLGGGGSHIAQQLAHIGVGGFVLVDEDVVEETNLNRLVGATAADALNASKKVEVAMRLIRGVNPAANITPLPQQWEAAPDALRDCDVIFGCVDGYAERDQLERLTRRFLIPYIDIGMDVHEFAGQFLITGQAALSLPGRPCLWCMGLLTQALLERERSEYGRAGHRPQVIWPNGILASTAVGMFMQLVTPWHKAPASHMLLEYDGNTQTVIASNKLVILAQKTCKHFSPGDVGDPFFSNT